MLAIFTEMTFLGFSETVKYFALLVFVLSLVQGQNYVVDEYENIKTKLKNSDEFCNYITCDKVEECEDGILLEKESYNRCCDVCVKFLDENDVCKEVGNGSLRDIGVSRCKKGLKCVNGKCVTEETVQTSLTCLYAAKRRRKLRETDLFSDDLWIPSCDKDGKYTPMQEKIRNSNCVDENGNIIFGSGNKILKNPCACSRYMLEKQRKNPSTYNIKPQEHCSQTGSFERLQCINDLCYCADEETGEVTGRVVPIKYFDKLPCYTSDSDKDYLKNCEKILQRSRKIVYDFHLKGIKLNIAIEGGCDPDGSFAHMYCRLNRCYCTDKSGKSTPFYEDREKVANRDINMRCNCARDEAAYQGSFQCLGYGNYRTLQCTKSMEQQTKCSCIDDDDGNIISKSSAEINEKTCENLLKKLRNEQSDDSRQTVPDTTDTLVTDVYVYDD